MVGNRWTPLGYAVLAVWLLPAEARAQRALDWELLAVDAHLDADGTLHVAERQTMVFTGDWNGGERKFDIRPGQGLVVNGIERLEPAAGASRPLVADASLDDVDDYSQVDAMTWRWRSRLTSDPPFANTRITYVMRYELSAILLSDGTSVRLDHDFAFPDRQGVIDRVTVRLTLDPVWSVDGGLEDLYSGGPLAPGESFTLTMPLRYTGTGSPSILDTRRPREVVLAVSTLLGVTALAIIAFFIREQRLGRFAPLAVRDITEPWLQANLVTHPAEVVGAAWDESIGASEVVALIARLVSEGKLRSSVTGSTMQLQLAKARESFSGYEAALIGGLFFDAKRNDTSTDAVKQHYKETGFDPARLIKKGVEEGLAQVMPAANLPRLRGWLTLLMFVAGAGALTMDFFTQPVDRSIPVVIFVVACVGALLLQIPGFLFRQHMKWGHLAALACMVPALIVLAAVLALFWWVIGTGRLGLSPYLFTGIVSLALWMITASINGMKSRQTKTGVDFRKRLTAAREFFESELETPQPRLRDEWYPWVLAFGLGGDAERWATRFRSVAHTTASQSSTHTADALSSPTTSPASPSTWTGAGGGRSGGAGGGAAWTAAASSMAAGVSAPSSSGSGGGGSSSSSSGSSGGGGGGGW